MPSALSLVNEGARSNHLQVCHRCAVALSEEQLIREEQLPQAAGQLRAVAELRGEFIPELSEEQVIREEQLPQAAGQLRAMDELRAERLAYSERPANDKCVDARMPLFLHQSQFSLKPGGVACGSCMLPAGSPAFARRPYCSSKRICCWGAQWCHGCMMLVDVAPGTRIWLQAACRWHRT